MIAEDQTMVRQALVALLELEPDIDVVAEAASGDEALAMARNWTPPELPVSGGDALKLGLEPGPKVGALIDAMERWWIDGDFAADRAACLAELERRARA